jgi:hypothetical protein
MVSYQVLRDTVESHLLATGLFASVNGHQPLAAPSGPVTASVWAGPIDTIRAASSLSTVKLRLVLYVTLYVPLTDPLDEVEVLVVDDSVAVMELVCGDFELGGAAEMVDLLGAYGQHVGSQLGYVRIGDGDYRTSTVTIPVILAEASDVTEAP